VKDVRLKDRRHVAGEGFDRCGVALAGVEARKLKGNKRRLDADLAGREALRVPSLKA